jgi:hypothetical protein
MGYDTKDAMRIAAIIVKSKGSLAKALQLTGNMANAITHSDKALRRARAAEDVNEHKLAALFFVRYGELRAVGR